VARRTCCSFAAERCLGLQIERSPWADRSGPWCGRRHREQARDLLTRSIQLSRATGSRIGIARGLEAFAALAVHENHPGQAVQLAAAAAVLRDSAGLPPLRGARAETYLAPARRLGEPAAARLTAQGQALSSDAAIALALDQPRPSAASDDSPALRPQGKVGAGERPLRQSQVTSLPGGL
jgi:hypothetical protein